jgi:uncharacterized protein YkwD
MAALGTLAFAAPASAPATAPMRMVLSASAAAAPASEAKSLGTATLYATHDRWRRFLASEQECPAGERSDLPPRLQVETLACLVNFARAQRGLRELRIATILNGASARKAQAILHCRRFAHNPCGGDWTTSVRSTGYDGSFGENLYLATGLFAAPRPTVDAWLNSAPHRANLFAARWREQGLALVVIPQLGDAQNVVVWVNVLGDRLA